ncbi:MAG: PEP-CTERM sorting domain-containing protein [Acidobacteriota bacterium]
MLGDAFAATVPEPSTLVLTGAAFCLICAWKRRPASRCSNNIS